MDSAKLARLAKRTDLTALLDRLDAMTEDELAALLGAGDGATGRAPSPKAYEPPAPDADFYDLLARQLSDEQQEIRRTLRRFLLDEVAPVANDYWERAEMPFDLVPGLRDTLHDALGPNPAERYCTDPLTAGIIAMEIPRVEPSLGTFLGVHWGLCLVSIWQFGSEAQKEKWVGPLERFEKIGSWALTEPEHGSDAALGLETTATRDGDTWTINGAKKWSGNATFADVTVIWARDTADGNVKGFLVEKGTPGFEVSKLEGKISKRIVQNVDITLTDVTVSEADRLPGVRTFRDVAGQLGVARAGVAWEACGMAMGLYETTLDYCTRRLQFGRPVAAFQLVQESLVRMLGNVVAIQGMMVGLGQLYDEPERMHERASLAKVYCVDKMRETASIGRGLLGGNGILLEHNVARLFADAEAVFSYEGSREMNVLITGRAITGLSAFV